MFNVRPGAHPGCPETLAKRVSDGGLTFVFNVLHTYNSVVRRIFLALSPVSLVQIIEYILLDQSLLD